MNLRLATGLAIACALAFATPTLAKTKKKKSDGGGKASGLYCEQGGQNAHFPITTIPAKYHSRIRKGMKFKVNIAEVGPIWCRAY